MKTKEEKQFDAFLDKYFDIFGKNYPMDITSSMTTEEHIARIEKALSDNKEVPEEPNEPDVTY